MTEQSLIDSLKFLIKLQIYIYQNTLQQANMQGQVNKSRDDTQLPKIQSQKRIYTTSDRRRTEDQNALSNRPLSNNTRTRSLRAFTSKSVKYQSTGNILNKKIEEVERQSYLVDKQTKQVQEEIGQLRQTIGISKKQPTTSRLNQSTASYFSKVSSKKLSLSDSETLNNELKSLEIKILNARKNIDVHLEKNKTIQQQIDTYRKEITTIKGINQQLEESFRETAIKYQEQMELSKKLDADIAQKTELTHRKKVENLHQKAQMIKQYDAILKTLDKELNNEKTGNQEDKSQFYLTDIANNQYQREFLENKSNQKEKRHLVSGKKPKISEIREKLKKYERQFEELKQKVGSENIEQITKKFTEEYQNNFHQYNFINEMYHEYEQANEEHFQLMQKKMHLLKQIQAEKSGSKIKEIHEFKDKLNSINKKKEKIKKDMLMYNKVALQLKMYLGQYISGLSIDETEKAKLLSELSDKTITQNLHRIYEKYSCELSLIYPDAGCDKQFQKNSSISNYGKQNIDDLIEEVKKQSQSSKDNRLLSRQEFQKNTLEMREKKMEYSALNNYKLKSRRQQEKGRSSQNSLNYKKSSHQ